MGVGQGVCEGLTLRVVVRFGGQRSDVGHCGGGHAQGHDGQTFERLS